MSALGFVGLGQIGAPMAGHLVDWPGGLVVCDVRPEAAAPFAERGARVAADASEVAASAELISIMVRDDDEVGDVVASLLDAARQGTVIAVHSTIRPGTAERLAEDASARGLFLVDAPVAGGFIGASAGTLAVLAGGDAGAIERCREPFERWADLIVHVGPAGAGTRAKLARNLLQFAAYAAAAEAMRLAEAAGIDLGRLGDVVRHSDRVTGGPGAIMVRDTATPMTASHPLYAIFDHTRELGEKDLRFALELGRDLGVELPFAELALARLSEALGVRGAS